MRNCFFVFLFFCCQTAFANQVQIVSSLRSRAEYSLFLKQDGTVWGWGWNSSGQIGDDTGAFQPIPVQTNNIYDIMHLADCSTEGCFSLAIKADGSVWIWGSWAGVSLGDKVNRDRLVPVQVPNISSIITGDVGHGSAMVVKNDGTVWSWGYNSDFILGLDRDHPARDINGDVSQPTQVPGLTNFVQVSLGGSHAIGLRSDGTVWTWGSNSSGELGRTTTEAIGQVQGVNNVIAVEAGLFHSIILKADGTVWAWGDNHYGQVGDGGFASRFEPRQVVGLSNIVQIKAGKNWSLALRSDGTVWGWGDDWGCCSGRQPTPEQDKNIPAMVTISSNRLGLSETGDVWKLGNFNERLVEPFSFGVIPNDFLPTSCKAFYFTNGQLVLPCVDVSAAGLEPPLFNVTMQQIDDSLQFQLTAATNVLDSPLGFSNDCLPVFSNNILDIPCTVVMHPSYVLQNPLHVKMNLLNDNYVFGVQEIQ